MASDETGWTPGIPKRAGWYFMRDEGATEPIVDGLVVWVGHNASGVRHEGEFYYADHKWLQRREFLGPVTVSDAEQLMELRRAAEQFVNAYQGKEHQLGNGQALRSFLRFRAALNPLQKETQ